MPRLRPLYPEGVDPLGYTKTVKGLKLILLDDSANDVTPDEARKTDEEAGQKKIPTPLDVLRESLEKAVKDIREEIVEKRIETV